MNDKGIDQQIADVLGERKPNYGRGMRKLRGILDLNQKEMAVRLGMTSQQLGQLEKKDKWTDEVLQRVADSLNIPVSGLDYLANESDLLGFIITNNTQGDGGIIGQNNFHNTYHFGNAEQIEKLFVRLESIINTWTQKVETMEKNVKKK